MDETGLTALDHARRKLSRLQSRPRVPIANLARSTKQPTPSQPATEQEQLDAMRRELPGADREFVHIWWQERLRAARRVFNDPEQVEQIVEILEAAQGMK